MEEQAIETDPLIIQSDIGDVRDFVSVGIGARKNEESRYAQGGQKKKFTHRVNQSVEQASSEL